MIYKVNPISLSERNMSVYCHKGSEFNSLYHKIKIDFCSKSISFMFFMDFAPKRWCHPCN